MLFVNVQLWTTDLTKGLPNYRPSLPAAGVTATDSAISMKHLDVSIQATAAPAVACALNAGILQPP